MHPYYSEEDPNLRNPPQWVRRERRRRERQKQKAALRERAQAVPKDGPEGAPVGRGEDPRFQVMGFFLEPKPESDEDYGAEVFVKDQLPEMVERASELPGDTLVQMDLADPDTGERSVRTLCVISGGYTHELNQ